MVYSVSAFHVSGYRPEEGISGYQNVTDARMPFLATGFLNKIPFLKKEISISETATVALEVSALQLCSRV